MKHHLHEVRRGSVGDLLTEYRNDVVAADIVLAVVDMARWVDSDGELAAMAFGDMRFTRHLRRFGNAPFGSLGHFTHGFAANDPSISLEAFMHLFVVRAQNIPRNARRRPGESAGMQASINRRAHVADDVGSHESLSC
ncbi:hypothetical protein [Bradyrhizobium sp. AUGA SZCCT0274]|uniref:hypothetical protein n=1 Tax=Bradyrhizobium sp. AUGA SZCCT0274 TaxID=2807670 RepID=UPI0020123D9A|nr:hypothetical protein [Bradyrhizobium sp. AUGA SZCCT0274]